MRLISIVRGQDEFMDVLLPKTINMTEICRQTLGNETEPVNLGKNCTIYADKKQYCEYEHGGRRSFYLDETNCDVCQCLADGALKCVFRSCKYSMSSGARRQSRVPTLNQSDFTALITFWLCSMFGIAFISVLNGNTSATTVDW